MLMSLPFLKSIYLDCQLELRSLLSFFLPHLSTISITFPCNSPRTTRIILRSFFPPSILQVQQFSVFSSILSIFLPVKVHFLHFSLSCFFPVLIHFLFFSFSCRCMILQFRRQSSRPLFTFQMVLLKTLHPCLRPSLQCSLMQLTLTCSGEKERFYRQDLQTCN